MKMLQELKQRYNPPFHRDLRELLNYVVKAYSQDVAFIIKHKARGKEPVYEDVTFDEFGRQVYRLGTALLKRGLLAERIAVMGKNRCEWMTSFFAVLCGGGVCVPLDKGLPYEEFESSLIRSEAKVLIFDPDLKPLVEQLKQSGTSQVETFICMEPMADCLDILALMEEGRAAIEEGFVEYENQPIDSKAVRILLFTSGTTSMAKAVMMSHHNITANVYSLQKVEDIRHGDVNMAFLPYHHTFGSTGQILMLACGVTTTYCDGLKYLQRNIVEYKVSVFFCVPLLIESIYKKIMATVKKQGKENTVRFGMALTQFLLKFGIDLRRRVFKQILDQLGGNIRLVISGAAAIDPEAIEGFNKLGITAIQGFGMTEASPVITAENSWERKTGSCGRAMPGVEVAIDQPDEKGVGEIIARGPNVMLGYYENEEETAKTLQDGWLHTGDLGYIDEDGFLFICGRKKNVIVLKNGKNVYPEEIELLISNLPYVAETMVFGQPRTAEDERDLVICTKIVYNPEAIRTEFGLDVKGADGEAAEAVRAQIEQRIRADIEAINETLPVYKKMLRVTVTDQPMVKTTTGKVKRFEEIKNL
ncbi:MAG: AMP-binding protein [Firmicutes bacterium]|nr:AMP-binding protein [Bacillota bacterium]